MFLHGNTLASDNAFVVYISSTVMMFECFGNSLYCAYVLLKELSLTPFHSLCHLQHNHRLHS